ncbi:MAG: phage holin family protein [Methylococcaceae bacterium]
MSAYPTEEIPAPSSGESADNPELLEDIRLLWLELRGLTHDHLKLVSLEVKRAGRSFVSMIVAGLIMAVLLISVWYGLMVVAALALIESNMVGQMEAILCVIAANLVAALLLFWFIRRKSHYLLFPETVRSLRDKGG